LANQPSEGGDAIANFFDLAFGQSLVANLAGTFIALCGAYWLYRWQESGKRAQVDAARSKRREQLLNALNETVTKNRKLLEQLHRRRQIEALALFSHALMPSRWECEMEIVPRSVTCL